MKIEMPPVDCATTPALPPPTAAQLSCIPTNAKIPKDMLVLSETPVQPQEANLPPETPTPEPPAQPEVPPPPVRPRVPVVLDSLWAEQNGDGQDPDSPIPLVGRTAKKPPDPEADIKDAQLAWMQLIAGRQQHMRDLQAIGEEARDYIFQSMQEAYIRRVKMQQKLLEAWSKAFFGWRET